MARRSSQVGHALVAGIVMGLVTLPVSCMAVMTAPMHSPGLIGPVVCPPGSQLVAGTRRSLGDKPGKTLTAACQDAAGKTVPRRDLNEQTLGAGLKVYYPICFLLLSPITITWIVRRWRRGGPSTPSAGTGGA